MRVVVIGAGFGGLAAAAHLIGAGHDVVVIERGVAPGGRAMSHQRPEGDQEPTLRLDHGPTVFTMPELLDEAFAAVGTSLAAEVQIERVDPMYRAVFADGSEIRVRHGREAMTEELRTTVGYRDAGVFSEFCEWVSELYRVEMPNFIDRNVDSPTSVLRQWRALGELVRLGGWRRLDHKVASFFDDPRLQRLFSFQSMYAGVPPHRALALYSVITYMDTVAGVYDVRGGLGQAASQLASAIERRGARIEYSTTAQRILRDGAGAVTGVEVKNGERWLADAVVCNVDLPIAYRLLVGGVDAPRAARRGTYSPSCVLWSAVVRGELPDGVSHHNLHFGEAWREAFDDLTKRGRLMRDPSIFVSVPSVTDGSSSPADTVTITALEPVPNLDGRVDWSKEAGRAADRLVERVAQAGYPTDDVSTHQTSDPLVWERAGLERGTPFALAHTWRQTGPFRPANQDPRVPGLFFAGASTVPGVGVPMVLLSGKLAAERVDRYADETRTVKW